MSDDAVTTPLCRSMTSACERRLGPPKGRRFPRPGRRSAGFTITLVSSPSSLPRRQVAPSRGSEALRSARVGDAAPPATPPANPTLSASQPPRLRAICEEHAPMRRRRLRPHGRDRGHPLGSPRRCGTAGGEGARPCSRPCPPRRTLGDHACSAGPWPAGTPPLRVDIGGGFRTQPATRERFVERRGPRMSKPFRPKRQRRGEWPVVALGRHGMRDTADSAGVTPWWGRAVVAKDVRFRSRR